MNKSKLFIGVLAMTLMFLVAGCSDSEDKSDSDSEENRKVLNVSTTENPSTLDTHMTTGMYARNAARPIFESLVTTDEDQKPVPMLAESIENDDNKIYTFHLREDIKFHNGEEMLAEDVIASMERWVEESSTAGVIFDNSTWESEDEYTVILTLDKASPLVLDSLSISKQVPTIMPKEIIDQAPVEGVTEYIGTGPFKLEEWKQDHSIHYTKFDGYKPVEEEPSGLSGKKEALVDDLYLYIMEDSSTRVSGLTSGEYDVSNNIPADQYEQIDSNPEMDSIIATNSNYFVGFNLNEGPASDFKVRQAINTAIDQEEIMKRIFPLDELYWLDSGYMDIDVKDWASEAGNEFYNKPDPEKAKKILEESEYDGEEFRLVAQKDSGPAYNQAVVLQEQLDQIGMNVELVIVDWPTLIDKVNKSPKEWDAYATGEIPSSLPTQLIMLSNSFGGSLDDPYVDEKINEIIFSEDLEKATENWDTLQQYAWEELLPVVPVGGNNVIVGMSNKVDGLTYSRGTIYWNTSVAE